MGPDRSWSIAPALLWFSGCLVFALWMFDDGIEVLSDRLTARREPHAAASPGPAFTAAPELADATDDSADTPAPVVGADRSKLLALEDACLDGTPDRCKRWAMDGFYRAMRETQQRTLGRALRVSWYGDSVIASDAIPNRFRTLLQAELGNGGPGFVYVVPPHRFCGHEAITRASGGTWHVHAISTMPVPDGLYGVGGSTVDTNDGRATIKLIAGTASHVELHYLAQPRGGTATITADGEPLATVATADTTKRAAHATALVEGGARTFEITTRGRVRLFGIDLENAGGAVVDNFGVVSVRLRSFDAHNAEHFRAELAHRSADLIMIMIGANEAKWLSPSDRDLAAYTAHYEALLAQVRRARPEAGCLVVSPTDQAEVSADGRFTSRAVMPALVKAQRSAAHAQGCAFYSTYDWMGGKGSAARWYRKGLVGTDFLHLSRKGSNRFSEALFGALMLGYQSYAAH